MSISKKDLLIVNNKLTNKVNEMSKTMEQLNENIKVLDEELKKVKRENVVTHVTLFGDLYIPRKIKLMLVEKSGFFGNYCCITLYCHTGNHYTKTVEIDKIENQYFSLDVDVIVSNVKFDVSSHSLKHII